MSDTKWSLVTKRLDLGKSGGGSPKMEYLMVGVLGLIILVSLGMTLHHLFFGGSAGPGSSTSNEMHFQCMQCKYEFVKSGKEFTKTMKFDPGKNASQMIRIP